MESKYELAPTDDYISKHEYTHSIDLEKDSIPLSPPLLSHFFFSWFNPIIKQGNLNSLSKSDLLELPSSFKSAEIFKSFAKCYNAEKMKRNSNRPSLWFVLHSLIFFLFWEGGLYRLFNDLLVIVGALIIKEIVAAAQSKNVVLLLFWATTILISSVLQSILLQQFIHCAFMSGNKALAATTSAVFHATLYLRPSKMNLQMTAGEINNVQAKDAGSLREFVVFSHNLWSCPLMIVYCVVILFYMIGRATLGNNIKSLTHSLAKNISDLVFFATVLII